MSQSNHVENPNIKSPFEAPTFHLKTAAARRWVDAVNRDGRHGTWQYHVVKNPLELGMALHRAAEKI